MYTERTAYTLYKSALHEGCSEIIETIQIFPFLSDKLSGNWHKQGRNLNKY